MNAWMYQPGVAATPATVADEGERVMVWRPGFGWVDRPAMPEAESETECEGAA